MNLPFPVRCPNKLLNGVYHNAHKQPWDETFPSIHMCHQTEVKLTFLHTRRLALHCSQGFVRHAGARGGRDWCYTNTKARTIMFQVVLSLEVSVNLLQMLLFVQFKEHPVLTFSTKTITSTSQLTCVYAIVQLTKTSMRNLALDSKGEQEYL